MYFKCFIKVKSIEEKNRLDNREIMNDNGMVYLESLVKWRKQRILNKVELVIFMDGYKYQFCYIQ